jgi:protein MpaA
MVAPSRYLLGMSRSVQSLQRLGRNHGGYFGETIDIRQVLRDDLEAARQFGWEIDELSVFDQLDLLALRRVVQAARQKFYISTGIHGDEPAGPLAVRQLLRENQWPAAADVWLCPCLNPTGCELNRRENAEGIDLNRDYRHRRSAEVRAHIAWLEKQPDFDVTLLLHEDWESHGFYVYEASQQFSLGRRIIDAVSKVCPIDHSPIIEDRPSEDGVIRPDIDPAKRPQWAEAFYLIVNKTRQSYTLEAPSDFPLETRVAALVAAVRAVFE